MKRTYICPAMNITIVQLQGLPIAISSVGVSSASYDEETMVDLVKQESSSSYSVWDDDWSE